MQGNLLIIEGIVTNRIALHVKLSAAWYSVTQAESLPEALGFLSKIQPDLILIGNSVPNATTMDVIAAIKNFEDGENTPPILVFSDDDSAREALLMAGAEDILAPHCYDSLMLARIRSIIRTHAATSEWQMRDDTSRALGFAEQSQDFTSPAQLMLLHGPAHDPSALERRFAPSFAGGLKVTPAYQVWTALPHSGNVPVIALALDRDDPEAGCSMLLDLRARSDTRHSAILVLVPDGRSDLAARALDLGADDVVPFSVAGQELAIRARRLNTRRRIAKHLRATIRSGAEAAVVDPLTGLYNRRYAMPHLQRLAEQAQSNGRPIAVMLADLDHFKQINDYHGHAAGDAVLIEVARRLKENLRAVDLLARVGGEEFLIVMPGTLLQDARFAALRLCNEIADKPFDIPGHDKPLNVTVSIGMALTEDGAFMIPEDMLARSDKALYRAKQEGRNCYMFEERPAA